MKEMAFFPLFPLSLGRGDDLRIMFIYPTTCNHTDEFSPGSAETIPIAAENFDGNSPTFNAWHGAWHGRNITNHTSEEREWSVSADTLTLCPQNNSPLQM